jgi:DNA-binding NtrC family response regulator
MEARRMARILVVDDDNSFAMAIAWMIEDAGHSIVGPEGTVEATRQVLARYRVDLALLDVLLGSETVFPVSEMLDLIGTPFIFVTGQPRSSLPAKYRHRPLMPKPCRPLALMTLIGQVLGERAAGTCRL